MRTLPMRASLIMLSCGLATVTALPVHAQNAQSVRMGEPAKIFSAGSILKETSFEGVVNVITGDNQLTGNRMLNGWTETGRLYLKLKNPGDAAMGDLYTVYRRTRKVFHPVTRQYLGYVVIRMGVVQVVQVDPTLVTASVVRSYAPILPGDPVTRFTPPSTEYLADSAPAPADMQAMVIELQSDKQMSLVSLGNIVYLDKGHDDGLRTGSRWEVFRTGGGLPERRIGDVQVIATEPHTATAVISKAMALIIVGDRLRAKPAASSEAMLSDEAVPVAVAVVQPVDKPATAPALLHTKVERLHGTTKLNLEDLADQLEYESGEVRVKPAGVPILEQLTEYLKTAGAEQIRVEGHADNMEIGPSLKGKFPTNWELSKARASEIVRYLVEKGGMDSAKLSAVGYGASRPVASNADEVGRKKNRRIEVVLESPEEAPQPQPVSTPAQETPAASSQISLSKSTSVSAEAATVSPTAAMLSEGAADSAGSNPAAPSDVPAPAAGNGESTPAPGS